MSRTIYLFLGFVGVVFVLNLLFLDYFFVKQRSELLDFQTRLATLSDSFKLLGNRFNFFPSQSGGSGSSVATMSAEEKRFLLGDVCPNSCMNLIYAATLSASVPVSASRLPTSQLIAPNQGTQPTPSGPKGEFIIELGSATAPSNASNQWFDAYTAQATFDTANFPPIKAFYFEVVMHVNSGSMQVKLVDDTTPFSYDGQVLTTISNVGQLLSAQVPLLSGKKTYHVRLYPTSNSGGSLDSARIHIVSQ